MIDPQRRDELTQVFTADDLPSYPVIRVAVITALVATASPYLVSAIRKPLNVLPFVVAAAALMVPIGLPGDVAAAMVLGYTIGAAVHLLFGSPEGRPTLEQVVARVGELGVAVHGPSLEEDPPWGEVVVEGFDGQGRPLRVKALGADAQDAKLLARVWHRMWYRGGVDDGGSPLERVNREALVTLLAERAHVSVPSVVAVGGSKALALLVERRLETRPLADLEPDELTPLVLDRLWRAVATLHGARLAHGALDLHRAGVTVDGEIQLSDLSRASTPAPPELRARRPGRPPRRHRPRRGTGARRPLGAPGARQRAARGRPALPAAGGPVAGAARRRPRPQQGDQDEAAARPAALGDHRHRRPGAGAGQAAADHLEGRGDGRRHAVRRLPPHVAGLGPERRAGGAQGRRLGVGRRSRSFTAQLPAFTDAVATSGAVAQTLAYGPLVVLQYAQKFTGLVVPSTLGTAAMNVRYLNAQSVPVATAVSSGVLVSLGGFVAQAIAFVIFFVISGPDLDLGSIDASTVGKTIVLAVIVVGRARHARVRGAQAADDDRAAGEGRGPATCGPCCGRRRSRCASWAATSPRSSSTPSRLGFSLMAFGESLSLPALFVVNTASRSSPGSCRCPVASASPRPAWPRG